jgi:hypothetical protein
MAAAEGCRHRVGVFLGRYQLLLLHRLQGVRATGRDAPEFANAVALSA